MCVAPAADWSGWPPERLPRSAGRRSRQRPGRAPRRRDSRVDAGRRPRRRPACRRQLADRVAQSGEPSTLTSASTARRWPPTAPATTRRPSRIPPVRGRRTDPAGRRAVTGCRRARARTGRGEFDDLLGAHVQRAFEQRRPRRAGPRPSRPARRARPARRTPRACRRSGQHGPRGTSGSPSAISGDPGQTRHLLDGLGESEPAAPGTVEPEGRHPHHHRARVERVHGLPAQPPASPARAACNFRRRRRPTRRAGAPAPGPRRSARSSVTPFLFALIGRWNPLYSHHRSRSMNMIALASRIGSRCVSDSTWMASAPKAASSCATAGPAHQAVRSSTFSPASGRSPVAGSGGLCRRSLQARRVRSRRAQVRGRPVAGRRPLRR